MLYPGLLEKPWSQLTVIKHPAIRQKEPKGPLDPIRNDAELFDLQHILASGRRLCVESGHFGIVVEEVVCGSVSAVGCGLHLAHFRVELATRQDAIFGRWFGAVEADWERNVRYFDLDILFAGDASGWKVVGQVVFDRLVDVCGVVTEDELVDLITKLFWESHKT